MPKNLLTCVFISSFLMLSGCSFLSPVKTATINTYTLDADTSISKKSSRRANSVLLISIPSENPGLGTSQMSYIEKPHQLNYYAHNRWIASPAKMLVPLMVESAENTGCFNAVVSAPFTSATDFTLQTNITMFQQEFFGDQSQVRVGLNTVITDTNTGKVKQKRFEATVPTMRNTPYAGVVATNEAVSAVLKQVNRFICAASK